QIRWEAPVDLSPGGRLSVGAGIAGLEGWDDHLTDGPRGRVVLLRAATGDVLGVQAASMLGPTTDGSRFILWPRVDDACPHPVCLNLMVMDAATGQIEMRPLSLPADYVVLS